MLHGSQEIKLSYDSVKEALNDYMQKHLLASVKLQVQKWDVSPGAYAGKQTELLVTFEQDKEP
jgi:hypothetical protein